MDSWLVGISLTLAGPGSLWGQENGLCLDTFVQGEVAETGTWLHQQYDAAIELEDQGRIHEALEAMESLEHRLEDACPRDAPATLAARLHRTRLQSEIEPSEAVQASQDTLLKVSQMHLGKDHSLTLEVAYQLARTLRRRGQIHASLDLQRDVLERRQRTLGSKHPETLATGFYVAGLVYDLGQFDDAQQRYESLLPLSAKALGEGHPQTLSIASNLAATLERRGQLQEAKARFETTLQQSRRVLGERHAVTLDILHGLATTLQELGHLQQSVAYQRLVVEGRSEAVGEEHSFTLVAKSNLARFLFFLGDWKTSRQMYEDQLAYEVGRFGDRHPASLASRNNLGVILQKQGDFQRATELFQKVLEFGPGVLGPEHPNLLLTQGHLASMLRVQGHMDEARHLHEEILEARTRLQGPEHQETLRAQFHLATTLLESGADPLAHDHYQDVFVTRQRLIGLEHPDTLLAALGLSKALRALGDSQSSVQLDEQSLEISRRILGEDHPDTLQIEAHLADTLREIGRLEESRRQFENIQQLRQRIHGERYQPSTEEEAREHFGLGRTLQRLGQPLDALASFNDGLRAIEAQALRVDPSEDVKSRYLSRYGSAYKEAIRLGLAAGQPAPSLHVLERYRTQSLAALLHWNHAAAPQDIPLNLREELHRVARRYDRLTREQDLLYPEQDVELRAEQARLRRRREVIQGQIIAARRAQGDLPQPLAADEVQGLLDPGTLLLSFAVGDEASHLFALTGSSLEAITLDVTSKVLSTQVDRLRALDLDGDTSEARQTLSQWLYERLLDPVASPIEDAQRVLIVPDGPLNFLPFAALTRSATHDPRGWQYLAEWKPMHSVQSATVYGELLAQREASAADGRPWQWVGFGNPVYPTVAHFDGLNLPNAVRSTTERGIWDGLTPLPHTEREIQGIARLFPKDRIQPLLHRDASEDRARQVLGQASIVHFAAHGLADPDYPMDSFLALSLDDGGTSEHNGLLQAWEIADQLRLDADLVVLSACVTALGPNRGGEGLISLSRAFQIAGARSVLASLWSVNDLSTSELMLRFYRHLQDGEPKDRALQLAQQELIHGPVEVTLEDGTVVERDFSRPYHWAAFQMIGDWK